MFCTRGKISSIPGLSNNCLSILCHIRLLLSVPKVQKDEKKNKGERVGCHGSLIQEGEKLAHNVSCLPFQQVNSLEDNSVVTWFFQVTKRKERR